MQEPADIKLIYQGRCQGSSKDWCEGVDDFTNFNLPYIQLPILFQGELYLVSKNIQVFKYVYNFVCRTDVEESMASQAAIHGMKFLHTVLQESTLQERQIQSNAHLGGWSQSWH